MDPLTRSILLAVMEREGGSSNHAADAGGETYRGVTLAEARKEWPGITFADLQQKTTDELLDFYWDRYVVAHKFHHIDDARLRSLLVDFGINSGPEDAVQALQVAVGVDDKLNRQPDKVGPLTLAAVRRSDPVQVYRSVWLQRWVKLDTLALRSTATLAFLEASSRRPADLAAFLGVPIKAVQRNPLFFSMGWNNRLREFVP